MEAARARLDQVRLDAKLPPDVFATRYLPQLLGPSAPPAARRVMGVMLADGPPPAFLAMAEAIAMADTRPSLARIAVPVLAVWGEDDVRSPVSLGRSIAAAIPGARLEILPGAGHVSNLHPSEVFNRVVRTFLRSLEGDALP